MSPAVRGAALAAILVLAGALRFAGLSGQGLLLLDEGHMILEARTCSALVRNWTGTVSRNAGRAAESARRLAREAAGCRITYAKPAHNVLLAAALAADPRADRATFKLSALAGTLTVALTGLLAAAFYGETAGILAALLLAVSPYHLLYSRTGLPDALTALFWIAALLAWVRFPGRRGAVVSGICAGLCFATNYREIAVLALLPAAFLLAPAPPPVEDRNRPARGRHPPRWQRVAGWLAGFPLPVIAFETGYRVLGAASGDPSAAFPAGTYLEQIGRLLAFHGGGGIGPGEWSAFGYYVLRWEGLASLGWLLVAVPLQLARWRGPTALLNAWLLLPWVVFSVYWDNASRFFLPLLPLVAVVKARWLLAGLEALDRFARGAAAAGARSLLRRPGLRAPSPSALAAAGAALLLPLILLPPLVRQLPRPSPYLEAARWLQDALAPVAERAAGHLSTNSRLGQAYSGEEGSAPIPPSRSEVLRQARAGWRYAVIDLQVHFGGFDRAEERRRTAAWIADSFPAVAEFPYSRDALAHFILEQDLPFSRARPLLASLEESGPALRIYDLSHL